jgi:hypothetical protein
MNTEVGIDKIEFLSSHHAKIFGRVFSGTLRIGDRFVLVCNLEHRAPEEKPIRKPHAQVDLIVTRLQTYGHEMEWLDEGLTGIIIVEGHGFESISVGMSIATHE